MLHCPTCGKNYPPEVKYCPKDQSVLQADATIIGNAPVDPLIGHVLDEKYKLEERLGIGGMGTVYRAKHLLIDRPVAVKVLNQRFVEDEAARTRFHREAKAAGRLQHLNAVAVTDYGQTSDGYVYIVMELLEGRTLRDILAKEAPLETARSVSLMLQIAAAVAAAHDAGIIHRDLKPANILVTQSADVPAMVKVLDFGIAKVAEEHLEEEEPKALTQVGAMIGTPRYMSPEQCSGLELTPAADVYSLGVILYEMLTGMVPFSGSSPLAIALKHTREPPRLPREVVATIPEEIERVVMHAMEKQPNDRPADASEFRSELLQIAENLGLEHHGLVTTPNLDALRNAGVQSPSGRLVVDLSRLREGKVLTSGSSELNVLGGPTANKTDAAPLDVATKPPERGSVPVAKKTPLVRYVLIVAAVLLVGTMGVFLVAPRWATEEAAPATGSPVVVQPSPTPSPTPSPSPSPSPKHQASKQVQKKKQDKGNSVLNKVKRILKNPF